MNAWLLNTVLNAAGERRRLEEKVAALDRRVPAVERKYERALRGQSLDTEHLTKEPTQ